MPRYYLLFIVLSIAISGCSKNNAEKNESKDTVDFLTRQPWLLLSYSYDTNGNGEVDSDENNAKDRDRNNTYIFNKDGSGVVKENQMVCGRNEQDSEFTWSLTDNDTIIDFYFARAHIVELSETHLRLTNAGNDSERIILIYGH